MLIVWALSHHYFRADMMESEFTTVITMKTLAFDVETLEVRIIDEGLVPVCKQMGKLTDQKLLADDREGFLFSNNFSLKRSKTHISTLSTLLWQRKTKNKTGDLKP